MSIREATLDDILSMQWVRNAVKENALSHPGRVTDDDYRRYLTERGKGWVYEREGRVVGFAIADLAGQNIWALFVHPEFDRQGIGRVLHDVMLAWYFSQTSETVWLGTAPHTRAERFYRKAGWKEEGLHGDDELKFEMSYHYWANNNRT